jgi:hypothetical protein
MKEHFRELHLRGGAWTVTQEEPRKYLKAKSLAKDKKM